VYAGWLVPRRQRRENRERRASWEGCEREAPPNSFGAAVPQLHVNKFEDACGSGRNTAISLLSQRSPMEERDVQIKQK